ncbi:hypothetical protein CATMIT_01818, partial [Catenibacterium mitsuokai DSM 15897]
RRDEAHQHDQAGVGHQLGHFGDAADVLDPVGVGETQILVQTVADVVAVEDEGVVAERVQLLVDQVGDGRLARARQAGEPHAARLLPLGLGARGLVDVDRLPVDVLGAAQGEVERAGGDGGVGLAVDQDEAAELAIVAIGLERDRLVQAEVAPGHFVEFEPARGQLGLGVDVDLVLDLGDAGG